MTLNPAPRLVSELKPKFDVKVDLDDRSFLFPALAQARAFFLVGVSFGSALGVRHLFYQLYVPDPET